MTKETNWKQKFQKSKNENFDLTNLNSGNKRNVQILGFGVYLNMEGWMVQFMVNGWGEMTYQDVKREKTIKVKI